MESTTRRGSGSSGSSMKSSLTNKGDLPPLPPPAPQTPSRYSDHQATVRNMPSGGIDPATPTSRAQREPSDEYEDYGDQYVDAHSSHSQIIQEGRGEVPLEDELPDTTMLDSVILPAIASVSNSPGFKDLEPNHLHAALPPRVNTRGSGRSQCSPACVYRR